MRTPPFLLAAALLLWGRETGATALAVVLSVVLEGSRLVAKRLELSLDNQNRIADLCTAVFALSAAYTYATADSADAARLMLNRSPLFFAPLLAAQAYGAAGAVDAGAFFFSLRRPGSRRVLLDLTFPYVAVCLLAAAGANTRAPYFYPCLYAVAAWALWHQRPRGSRPAACAALLLLAGGLGYAGHRALAALQPSVEQKAVDFAYGLSAGRKDVFRSRTAIGSIGELKRSGGIVLRLTTPDGRRPPALLRNAAYDVYKGRDWLAGSGFTELPGRSAEGSWELRPAAPDSLTLLMDASMPDGEGPLALPPGASSIAGLPALSLKRSRLGAVVVEGGPKNAELSVRHGSGPWSDDPPSPADLAVPKSLRPALDRTVAALGLRSTAPREAMAALETYFSSSFSYSLVQDSGGDGADPLEDFLERTKSGHCEHFATATALLLRSVGVPARYATGFAVLEYSRLERAWVVRRRHAHAWTQAFVDGAWTDLDTTPDGWPGLEADDVPVWQPAADLGAWLRRQGRRALREDFVRTGAMWGLAGVALFLAWRLRSGLGRLSLGSSPAPNAARPGADSELYAVETALLARGLGRRPHETPLSWARRLAEADARAGALVSVARLHERYRFDPAGLAPAERTALREGAAAVLADFDKT